MSEKNYNSLPQNINYMTPMANKDAVSISKLIKKNGKITGYELSDGQMLTKSQGVSLAKQGGIKGVAIATRNGGEYLRSLPDGAENNNLSNLPSVQS